MRIALCISGQPRGLPQNILNIKHGLIDPSNITDIFIHTWFDKQSIGKPFNSAQPHQTGQVGVWHPHTIQLLESLHPIRLDIESPRDFSEYNDLEGLPSAIQSQLASNVYSVYKANELKTNYEIECNFEYDLVIRARIDCFYETPYNILGYLDDDWKNVLHVPYIHQVSRTHDSYPTKSGLTYSSLSDTFAYGSSNVMNKFCSVYPNFRAIHQEIYPFPYGECYFGYQVRHVHNISISMQPINYTLTRYIS